MVLGVLSGALRTVPLRPLRARRHLLRGVLPQRPPPRVDVLLVLRGAAAPPRGRPGMALRPWARVLGGRLRARGLQRRPLLRGAALGHPVHPAHPARGLGRLRAHRGPGLSLRDPAHRAAPHHSARHQRVAQPPQELVGGADHQRGRADLPDAPDRDLYREGHRGPHRGHGDLPRPLSLHLRRHGAGSSAGPRSPASSRAGGAAHEPRSRRHLAEPGLPPPPGLPRLRPLRGGHAAPGHPLDRARLHPRHLHRAGAPVARGRGSASPPRSTWSSSAASPSSW